MYPAACTEYKDAKCYPPCSRETSQPKADMQRICPATMWSSVPSRETHMCSGSLSMWVVPTPRRLGQVLRAQISELGLQEGLVRDGVGQVLSSSYRGTDSRRNIPESSFVWCDESQEWRWATRKLGRGLNVKAGAGHPSF